MRNIQQSGDMYGKHMTLSQVNKTKAKKLFSKGVTIYLQSCNMSPFGMWQNAFPCTLDLVELESQKEMEAWRLANNFKAGVHPATPEGQFDCVVNSFGYYNLDSERGYYASYYIEV